MAHLIEDFPRLKLHLISIFQSQSSLTQKNKKFEFESESESESSLNQVEVSVFDCKIEFRI